MKLGIFTSQFQTLSSYAPIQRIYEIGGASITFIQLAALALGILIMLALAWILKFTLFGKAIKAIADDEDIAKILRINPS